MNTISVRKRDLVIRIADWTRDKHEPTYDVECYVHGAYGRTVSETFCTKSAGRSKRQARDMAVAFAQQQIARLL